MRTTIELWNRDGVPLRRVCVTSLPHCYRLTVPRRLPSSIDVAEDVEVEPLALREFFFDRFLDGIWIYREQP